MYLALGVVASAYIPKLLPHIGSGGLSALHWAIYQSARVLRAKNIEPMEEFKLKSPTTPPSFILPTPNEEEEEEEDDRLLLPVLAILLFALLCALLLLWSCYCRGQSAERWTTLKETTGRHFSRLCPCCPTAAQEGEEEEKGNTAASNIQQQQQQIAGYNPGEMLSLIMEAPAENSEQPFDAWPKRGKSKKTKKKKKKRKTTSPLLFESSVTTEEASSSEAPKKHKKKSRSRRS